MPRWQLRLCKILAGCIFLFSGECVCLLKRSGLFYWLAVRNSIQRLDSLSTFLVPRKGVCKGETTVESPSPSEGVCKGEITGHLWILLKKRANSACLFFSFLLVCTKLLKTHPSFWWIVRLRFSSNYGLGRIGDHPLHAPMTTLIADVHIYA